MQEWLFKFANKFNLGSFKNDFSEELKSVCLHRVDYIRIIDEGIYMCLPVCINYILCV